MRIPGDFQADLEKYYRIEFGGKPPSLKRRVKLWTTHFGFHCVAVYRLGRFARTCWRKHLLALPLVLLYECLAFMIKLIHHVDIFAADIGPGFYIGHAGTIYIGRTRVGANFSVTHNVTVGLGAARGSAGVPAIGDDVWVGAGSILYGDITIGNGVAINGGTVLSKSLPDRCLAGGNPCRVLLVNYDNASLFGGYYGGTAVDSPASAPGAKSPAPSPTPASDAKAPTPVPAAHPAPAPAHAPAPATPAPGIPLVVATVHEAQTQSEPEGAQAPLVVTPVVVTPVPVAPVTSAPAAAVPAATAAGEGQEAPATVTAATVTPIAVAPMQSAPEIPAEAA